MNEPPSRVCLQLLSVADAMTTAVSSPTTLASVWAELKICCPQQTQQIVTNRALFFASCCIWALIVASCCILPGISVDVVARGALEPPNTLS